MRSTRICESCSDPPALGSVRTERQYLLDQGNVLLHEDYLCDGHHGDADQSTHCGCVASDNGDSYVYASMFFGVSFLIATLVMQIVRLGLGGLLSWQRFDGLFAI
jgi:hypothetical protein